jgi:polyhydroxyalkanoate synthesis regulator phasin
MKRKQKEPEEEYTLEDGEPIEHMTQDTKLILDTLKTLTEQIGELAKQVKNMEAESARWRTAGKF